jgi:hypothetical protein
MQDNIKKTLVLVSIPFWRVGKVLISNKFLSSLDDPNLIIGIVGPLNIDTDVSSIIDGRNIVCYKWKPKFSKIIFQLYNISEILRMNGYWFRFRNTKMKYYYHNMFVDFHETGNDKRKNFFVRLTLFILSSIGCIKFSWNIIDWLISNKYDYPKEFESITRQYKRVVLIQSSSWGEQDRVLASWSKKNKIDSYLIPYTTDQLVMNGYLLNKYKKIFVQGPIEYEYATKIHKVPKDSVYKAGSLWFRNLDEYLTLQRNRLNDKIKSGKTVLYAGVLPLYYPREFELAIVKSLFSEFISENKGIRFIYRPYISSELDKNNIIKCLSECKGLDIQWPEAQINQLNYENIANNLSDSIAKEINRLMGIDLFIMSVSTSMCIDAAYLSDCPVISNMIDFDMILSKRHTLDSLVDNSTLTYVPGVDVAFTIEELISKSKSILQGYRNEEFSSKRIVSSWDYHNDEFPDCIKSFILKSN